MCAKPLLMLALMILNVPGLKAQDSSEIIFASSFYKTSSGAIGPQHITATTTYGIKINDITDLKIDSMVIAGKRIVCQGIALPSQGNTIDFTIIVATHQSSRVWYTSRIILNENTSYSCQVQAPKKNDPVEANPVIVLYGQGGNLAFELIKDKFDQEHSQYNK